MKNYGTDSTIILKDLHASYRFKMAGMREPGKIRYRVGIMTNFSTEFENVGTCIIDANCTYEEMIEIVDKKIHQDALRDMWRQKYDREYEDYKLFGLYMPDHLS